MIAAIANYMDYDIYDLELTSVKTNVDLKDLLIDTRSKSIIVIEDIDCSVDLTKKRKEAKKKKDDDEDEDEDEEEEEEDEDEVKDKKDDPKVTLSGLLNFIDGIWSGCGEERIIFTTNHVDKLNLALIRRGRMDMHIEMSYCKFEAFKILAKNYLQIDSHPFFDEIAILLENNKVSPCDVAENLMPKSDPPDVDGCLRTLMETIKVAKEAAAKAEKDKADAIKAAKEGKEKEDKKEA